MADATRHTVLVVDDVTVNVQLLVEILREHYKVIVAMDGRVALERVQKQKPDLILLDVMMPEMDGFEVCRRLKMDEATASIPIIFVTAKNEVLDETQGLEIGAMDYIVKPVSAPIVLARVRTHLELYDQNRRLESMVAKRTRQLEKALEKAEEASRAKSEFLANMTHELRTPMNKIMGMVQLMQQLAENDDQRQLLHECLRAAEGLTGMLNRLLQLSALDSGQWTPRLQPFDLRQSLAPLRQAIQEAAESKNLAFSWQLAEDLPANVEGDRDKLIQAAGNVLLNAVQFTERGAVDVHLLRDSQNLPGPDPDAFMLRLSVSDSGPGILPELQEKIFHPFEIGEHFLTKRSSGAGMGLAITRRLMDAMQGRIWLESTPNKGSTFHLAVPLRCLD